LYKAKHCLARFLAGQPGSINEENEAGDESEDRPNGVGWLLDELSADQ